MRGENEHPTRYEYFARVGGYSNKQGLVVGNIRRCVDIDNRCSVFADTVELVKKAANISQESCLWC